ncbi:MAG: HypC/HybG/HupF family hydrogenase formation chaperone [Bdellovibrionales bacterium]|nr:HypC/HybG/HupF family hydrogenase formation chaperone [Bdellovibrionales bacterium]
MCLGVPGRIESISGEGLLRRGQVSFAGVAREVALTYVPEAKVGDFVVVHVGVAISVLSETQAQRAFDAYRELEGDPNEVCD